VTYTLHSKSSKSLLSVGSQESKFPSITIRAFVSKSWLFGFYQVDSNLLPLKTTPKNYSISGYQIAPKISYLFSKVRLGYILRTTKQSDRIQKHCCKIDLAHPFPYGKKK
jgi:hypothetical protein